MQHDLKQRIADHVRCSGCGAAGVGVAHVVDGEAADVRKKFVVGEVVVVAVSSRVSALPKNLIALSRTGSREAEFRRPVVPSCGARRKKGWRRLERRRDDLERGGGTIWRCGQGRVCDVSVNYN